MFATIIQHGNPMLLMNKTPKQKRRVEACTALHHSLAALLQRSPKPFLCLNKWKKIAEYFVNKYLESKRMGCHLHTLNK
jgi:hypothetical protein